MEKIRSEDKKGKYTGKLEEGKHRVANIIRGREW